MVSLLLFIYKCNVQASFLYPPPPHFLFFGGCFWPRQPCPHTTFLWTALPARVGHWRNTKDLLGLKRKWVDCEFFRGYRWFWSLCRKHYGSWASQGTSPGRALLLCYWFMGRNTPLSKWWWGKSDQAKMTHREMKPPGTRLLWQPANALNSGCQYRQQRDQVHNRWESKSRYSHKPAAVSS